MRIVFLLSFLMLGACSTTSVVPLTYTPQATATRASEAQPIVDVGQVSVSRVTGREDPLWVGAIRGGYGNPLKVLHADVPIDQVVTRALREGLRVRGLLVGDGAAPQRRLAVDIMQFDANQYVRREATVVLRVSLVDAVGQQLWTDSVRVHRVNGSLLSFSTGVFASVEDLHALMAEVLGEAVDQTLDNPAFRLALRAP